MHINDFATMKAISNLRLLFAILLAFHNASNVVLATEDADSQRVYEAVRTGIQEFQSGNLAAATAKFEEANSLSTDDTVIQFDQACVDLAKGQEDSAREKLRQAVAGSDPEVVQSAHYNLGFLKVQQAKTKLQPDPAAVAQKVRTEVVDQLEQAARHFRNTLEINADHEDAAFNLELIRMYLKQLKTIWKQQDEQQQQPEESLTQLLLRLQESFQAEQQQIVTLQNEADSASRQDAVLLLQGQLREVDSEVGKVRPLFEQWLQSVMPSGNSQNPSQQQNQPTEEKTEAIKALTSIVDQLEGASDDAVAAMATEDWAKVREATNQCILSIHQLFLNVASYQETLQAALDRQQKLNSQQSTWGANQIPLAAQQQLFVSDFSRALRLQAEQQQPQIEQQLQQLEEAKSKSTAQLSSPTPPSGTSQPGIAPPSVLQLDEQKATLEGLKESMSRAIELVPDAVLYADMAASDMLTMNDSQTGANSDQEMEDAINWAQGKVLLILKDIAEPIRDPDSDQQQSDQQQQSDEQNEQDSEDDQSSDQQDSKNESAEQQEPQESEGPEDPSADSGDEERSKDNQEGGQPQPLAEMAQREAEAVLRKAAEREQEYRELKRQLLKLQGRRGVKKDW